MGRYVFKLSDVGEGIAECEIATWRVAVGDVVTEDQPLVDMLTEKAAVELPSPVAGKIIELHGEAGDMIAVGSPLVVLEVEGAGNAKDEPPKNEPQKKISSPPAGGRGQGEGGGGAAAVSVPASAAAPPSSPPSPQAPPSRERSR